MPHVLITALQWKPYSVGFHRFKLQINQRDVSLSFYQWLLPINKNIIRLKYGLFSDLCCNGAMCTVLDNSLNIHWIRNTSNLTVIIYNIYCWKTKGWLMWNTKSPRAEAERVPTVFMKLVWVKPYINPCPLFFIFRYKYDNYSSSLTSQYKWSKKVFS